MLFKSEFHFYSSSYRKFFSKTSKTENTSVVVIKNEFSKYFTIGKLIFNIYLH